jgi:hypothetical protein
MPWETFQRQRTPLVLQPYVTIQKRGTLSLNSAAYEALDSPDAVELLYDRATHRVGIRKVSPEVEHAYQVRPNGTKARSFLVAGSAFTQYYGIETGVARRWPAEGTDGEAMIVIDLRKPGTEIVSNRNKARRVSEDGGANLF